MRQNLEFSTKMIDHVECPAEQLIKDHKYLMVSKSWCPDCHYVYKIWDAYGIADKVYIIELDKFENQEEATRLEDEFTRIAGRKWVPTIFFNGKKLGTEADLKVWKSEGSLESRFRAEGIL